MERSKTAQNLYPGLTRAYPRARVVIEFTEEERDLHKAIAAHYQCDRPGDSAVFPEHVHRMWKKMADIFAVGASMYDRFVAESQYRASAIALLRRLITYRTEDGQDMQVRQAQALLTQEIRALHVISVAVMWCPQEGPYVKETVSIDKQYEDAAKTARTQLELLCREGTGPVETQQHEDLRLRSELTMGVVRFRNQEQINNCRVSFQIAQEARQTLLQVASYFVRTSVNTNRPEPRVATQPVFFSRPFIGTEAKRFGAEPKRPREGM
jgi:hypothetical protein